MGKKDEEYIKILEKHLSGSLCDIKSETILKMWESQKEMCVRWMLKNLNKPFLPNGTQGDLPPCFNLIGKTGRWEIMRECVLCRDGYRCQICGRRDVNVHHIRPRQFNGKNHPLNLITICKKCHHEAHQYIEAGMEMIFAGAIGKSDDYLEKNQDLNIWV